jgi:CheY-like chemotaxis protein
VSLAAPIFRSSSRKVVPTIQKLPAAPPPDKKFAILLVDDHALFRRGLADLLNQGLDMAVIGRVDTGAAALTAVRRDPFELVIMDIGGAGTDGLETAKRLRAEPATSMSATPCKKE